MPGTTPWWTFWVDRTPGGKFSPLYAAQDHRVIRTGWTKAFQTLSHRLKILVDETQKGHMMQTHDSMPERIRQELYAEEQQQGERDRKRKRRDSCSYMNGPPAIHIHNAPGESISTKGPVGTPSTPHMVFPTCSIDAHALIRRKLQHCRLKSMKTRLDYAQLDQAEADLSLLARLDRSA
jgi:hypothetical protein